MALFFCLLGVPLIPEGDLDTLDVVKCLLAQHFKVVLSLNVVKVADLGLGAGMTGVKTVQQSS